MIAKLRTLQPKIIGIYHLVNLCVRTATTQLPLKVDELLVDIYYHFQYSVKRIASLQEYADFCRIEYKNMTNSTFTSKCLLHPPCIHKLHGKSLRFLRTVLSFFIKPCAILQNSSDLTAVDYADESNLLSEKEI